MVAINRLTVRGIAGLADGNHSDGGNLYLRKKGQRASWVFRYKLKGRVKELGLGSYPSRSLSEVRKVAAELRTQLLDGLPVRSLKSHSQESDVPTLRESAFAYIEAKRPEWTNQKHAQQWTNTLETYVFPKIGDYLPSEVDLSAVEAVLQPIWSQKTETATRITQRLEAILDWTIVHGYRAPDNPARWKNNWVGGVYAGELYRPLAANPHRRTDTTFASLRQCVSWGIHGESFAPKVVVVECGPTRLAKGETRG